MKEKNEAFQRWLVDVALSIYTSGRGLSPEAAIQEAATLINVAGELITKTIATREAKQRAEREAVRANANEEPRKGNNLLSGINRGALASAIDRADTL